MTTATNLAHDMLALMKQLRETQTHGTPEHRTQRPGRCPMTDVDLREAAAIMDRAGGRKTFALYGRDHMAAMGQVGGAANAGTHGSDHMAAMGKQGGKKLAAERGSAYYSEIARKSWQSRRAPKDAA